MRLDLDVKYRGYQPRIWFQISSAVLFVVSLLMVLVVLIDFFMIPNSAPDDVRSFLFTHFGFRMITFWIRGAWYLLITCCPNTIFYGILTIWNCLSYLATLSLLTVIPAFDPEEGRMLNFYPCGRIAEEVCIFIEFFVTVFMTIVLFYLSFRYKPEKVEDDGTMEMGGEQHVESKRREEREKEDEKDEEEEEEEDSSEK